VTDVVREWTPRFEEVGGGDDARARSSSWPRRVPALRVEISLDAIVANAVQVQRLVGPSKGVVAMLKADAYGHGLVRVARALEHDGTVAALAVSSVRDGIALRREGVDVPILAMVSHYAGAHGAVLDAGITPVLASRADLDAFLRAARERGVGLHAHVEIDSGMSRTGLREDELPSFLDALAARPEIAVAGLCTHLASADALSSEGAHRQLDAFEQACERFRSRGHRPTMVHAANTAAIFRVPRAHFTHVRTGVALFGGDEPSRAELLPAMRVSTPIAQLRTIRAGESVSYGEAWRATHPARIATLPVGYAHGYPRRLSGRASVLVGGRRCPVVGVICMEMTMIDVTSLGADVHVDDEAVLLGREGTEEIRAVELARSMDGIVEEIFCGLSNSGRRVYQSSQEHDGAARSSGAAPSKRPAP
jgi:alanine racemase